MRASRPARPRKIPRSSPSELETQLRHLRANTVKTRLQQFPKACNPKCTAPINLFKVGLGKSGQCDPRAGDTLAALGGQAQKWATSLRGIPQEVVELLSVDYSDKSYEIIELILACEGFSTSSRLNIWKWLQKKGTVT